MPLKTLERLFLAVFGHDEDNKCLYDKIIIQNTEALQFWHKKNFNNIN
jgi:hypothetical protein